MPVKKLIAGMLLMAAGCRDERPPAPTQEQSAQLNDAENMLNQQANAETNDGLAQ